MVCSLEALKNFVLNTRVRLKLFCPPLNLSSAIKKGPQVGAFEIFQFAFKQISLATNLLWLNPGAQ